MTTVRLTDAIIPEVYLSYGAVNSVETNAFAQCGIAVSSEILNNLANGTSRETEMPYWKDLDMSVEPNYGNDDPDDKAIPGKVDAGYMKARRAFVNKSYSAMDLVSELVGSNPMQRIRNRFGTYWQGAWQRRLIATCIGMQLNNAAEDDGDMIVDVAIEDGAAATSANVFSRTNFVNAAFTLGDKVAGVQAIAVHSIIHKRMVDNDDIEMMLDSDGTLSIPTYMGKRVIVDDGMPVTAGSTSGYKYTSILFGAGVLGYGQAVPANPIWLDRDEQAGNGQGMEEIGERHIWLIHPVGYRWLEASVSEESPTIVNLKNSANWSRVVDRKLVPVAFLITNG